MKILCTILVSMITLISQAQEKAFPFKEENWEYDETKTEFITHRSVNSAKSIDGQYFEIHLKDQQFSNGTIEFDVELIGNGFPGINFRMSDDHKDGEVFYLRSFGPTSPYRKTNIQYAAVIDGINMWNMTEDYQSGAKILTEGWNHVKLVINGKQMQAYVNDMDNPSLIVPELEGERMVGGITLTGNVIYANFSINKKETGNLHADPGFIPAINDTRYIRNWEVLQPVDLPTGRDVVIPVMGLKGSQEMSFIPVGEDIQWIPVQAEKRGMVNLTRKFGAPQEEMRRFTWLKTTINSESTQEQILRLGFSDEVWIFINGQFLYMDKNYYGTPSMKEPRGRCTIENAEIKLPLQEGENELLIGSTNFFYGWGVIARFDKMDGIWLAGSDSASANK